MTPLKFGPLDRHAVHVCVDMQRFFAEGSEWAAPATFAVLSAVERLCAHAPERTVFTRFLTPKRAEDATGQWRTYYGRWASVLADRLDPDMFDLLPALRRFTPPAQVIDKWVHSAFEAPAFQPLLDQLRPSALVFSGVETDVCVLATALTAVDRGYRTILVTDAITSSSAAGHDASLEAVFPRFDMQVETTSTDDLLKQWPR
jgi:nicotinamidase-related amidase